MQNSIYQLWQKSFRILIVTILLIHVLSILKNLFYIWREVLSYIPNLGSMEKMVRFFMDVEYISYNSCFNRFYIIKFLR